MQRIKITKFFLQSSVSDSVHQPKENDHNNMKHDVQTENVIDVVNGSGCDDVKKDVSETYESNDISLFSNLNRSPTDAEKILVRSESYNSTSVLKLGSFSYNRVPSSYFGIYLFFTRHGGVGNQKLGQLVIKPFINFKHAQEVFRTHAKCEYHLKSVIDAERFLNIFEKKEIPLIQQIDSERAKQVQENRKRLIPIIQCVILCGREEIPLRGHRDFGTFNIEDEQSNEGNFRAILKYRAKGDEYLKSVLEGPGKRNKYTSPGIQNQIIEACNKLILNKIVDKINKSQCFSILADETTDVSNIEQLSLCVRYVDNNNMLNEDFIQFIAIHSLTGLDLVTSILKGLSDCGVNSEFMYGQGYDGASNMAGQFKGVQKIIRDKYPNALYVHCSAHSLNLAVSSSSNIKPIRNSLHFISIEWKDSSSTDANMFLKCIQDSEFLVSLYVTKVLFSYGLPVCKQLQKERIDLKKTVDIVENLIQSLMNVREDAEHEFKRIVDEAQTTAELIGTSISRKRITSKQTNRANPQNLKSTEDYYRVTVFLPYIDNFISQLKDRFVNHKTFKRIRVLISFRIF
ncbi:unnamed protein product [Macrosiphum euphorbiae]|uniref:DUF4371 domain-containing protein n=1 Tax=Macrosiphum euphorbiae TaxID=13131 RepID=A0AAV0W6Y4_9HEMI|nr:unnamed protein product [Macrosiphum euphorbiae]